MVNAGSTVVQPPHKPLLSKLSTIHNPGHLHLCTTPRTPSTKRPTKHSSCTMITKVPGEIMELSPSTKFKTKMKTVIGTKFKTKAKMAIACSLVIGLLVVMSLCFRGSSTGAATQDAFDSGTTGHDPKAKFFVDDSAASDIQKNLLRERQTIIQHDESSTTGSPKNVGRHLVRGFQAPIPNEEPDEKPKGDQSKTPDKPKSAQASPPDSPSPSSFVLPIPYEDLDGNVSSSCQDSPKWASPAANSMWFAGKTCDELKQFSSSNDHTAFCKFLSQENSSSGPSVMEACCFCGGGEYLVSAWRIDDSAFDKCTYCSQIFYIACNHTIGSKHDS